MRLALGLILAVAVSSCLGCGDSDKKDITKHPDYQSNPDPRSFDPYGGTPLDPNRGKEDQPKKGEKK